jgi:hypothetical protein
MGGDGWFSADPADTFNAVLTFTTWRIPGDPRTTEPDR